MSSLPSLLRALYVANVKVAESDSDCEKDITAFPEPKTLEEYIATELSSRRGFVGIALYYPEAKGYVRKRKVKLNPTKCDGATFRYAMEGWGLIHLQLRKKDPQTVSCRIAVNSEKRASTWADTYPEFKSPALWNWQIIEKHARRLIRELKKCA